MTDGPAFPQLAGQRGLATVRQLRDAGFTVAQIRHARKTSWQTPFPGVVAPHRGPLDHATQVVGAGLWAGPRALLTGHLALQLQGLHAPDPAVATFLVPQTARARSTALARTIRTHRPLPDRDPALPVQLMPAVRALTDAAQYEALSGERAEELAIATLQRRLGAPEDLEAELWQRPHTLVDGLRSGLTAFREGAWSRPEATLRAVVTGTPGLPELFTNCRLETPEGAFVAVPDGYFPAAGTAVQVHSRLHHQGIDQEGGDRWAQTVERDSAMVTQGIRVVQVSPWTLYRRPQVFIRRLVQVVAHGLAAPPPPVRLLTLDGHPITWWPRTSGRRADEHPTSGVAVPERGDTSVVRATDVSPRSG